MLYSPNSAPGLIKFLPWGVARFLNGPRHSQWTAVYICQRKLTWKIHFTMHLTVKITGQIDHFFMELGIGNVYKRRRIDWDSWTFPLFSEATAIFAQVLKQTFTLLHPPSFFDAVFFMRGTHKFQPQAETNNHSWKKNDGGLFFHVTSQRNPLASPPTPAADPVSFKNFKRHRVKLFFYNLDLFQSAFNKLGIVQLHTHSNNLQYFETEQVIKCFRTA